MASESRLQIYSCGGGELKLIWEKNFWGNIFAVFSHRIGEYDSLILGIDNTKVVLLSPVGGVDLQEVEWHSFQDDGVPECVRHPTMMVKDERNSCIAMIIAGEWLLFLTLCQKDDFAKSARPRVAVGQHSGWDVVTGATCQSLIDDCLPAQSIFRVRDIKFLDGYNRPTLAIMHEPIPTWSVRLPFQKSTIVVSLVSPLLIERERKQLAYQMPNKVTWKSKALPHNSLALVPVKPPHGGFLVLSKNAIIYMTHTSGLAYGLNALAKVDDECPFEITDGTDKPYEIYSPVYCVIDESHILITVDEHKFGIVKLHDNGVDVTGISLYVHEDFEIHPSLVLPCGNDMFFCGSTVHDSMMLSITPFFEKEEMDTFVTNLSMNDEEISLYQRLYQSLPTKVAREMIRNISIRELSRIYQIGTVSTACPFVNYCDGQDNDDSVSMALGCGFRSYGCLQYLGCSLNQTIKVHLEFQVADATAAFGSNNHKWILFSNSATATGTTVVFRQQGASFAECTGSVASLVNTKEYTIAASDFGNGFVQVTRTAVRYILRDSVQEYPFESEIKHAKLDTQYILLTLASNQLYLCDGASSDGQLSFTPLQIPESRQSMKCYKTAVFHDKAFLLQDTNALHIYSLTRGDIVCTFEHFRYFLDVVHNEGETQVITGQPSVVADMNVVSVGDMTVLVLIMKEGHVILYQLLEKKIVLEDGETYDFALKRIKTRRLTANEKASMSSRVVPFTNVNTGNGVMSGGFICGSRPMFLVSESGYPRLIPAPAGSFFTQLESQIVFGDKRLASIATFDFSSTETHIIDGCVVQRVPLGRTPRHMTYVPPWRALVVMTSTPVPFILEYEPQPDGKPIEPEEGIEPHYQKPLTPPRELEVDGLPQRTEEHYEVYVARADGINQVLQMERHEVGLCMAFVHTLDNYEEPEHGQMNEYLAIGSGFWCHEERTMRGRLAIYKGTVVQSEDMMKSEYKLHEMFKKNMLGAVTSICDLNGHIVHFAEGQMRMHMFGNGEAIKSVGFTNGHFYCKQMISMKNYILFIDMYKGFQLVRWRNYGKKLITMAKDFSTHLPVSGGILTNGGAFGGVVFDHFGNAQIFEYDEYAIPVDACFVRSVFHIGCRAISGGNFPIRGVSESGKQQISGHFVWFVSDKGKIGAFTPMKDDATRRRLCVIQTAFEKVLAGLSHLEYRTGKFEMVRNDEQKTSSPRLIVDVDLLFDMLECQPDIQRQCIKSGRNIGDVTQILGEVCSVTGILE